ncbi:hypothetical protein ACTA71_004459 [Dictyostelium dimigraforme]
MTSFDGAEISIVQPANGELTDGNSDVPSQKLELSTAIPKEGSIIEREKSKQQNPPLSGGNSTILDRASVKEKIGERQVEFNGSYYWDLWWTTFNLSFYSSVTATNNNNNNNSNDNNNNLSIMN